MSAPIDVVRDGAVVDITLRRPPLNILDRALNRALANAVRAHANDRDVAVLVLRGGSAKGFSAGVEVADHTPERVSGMLEDFHEAVRALWAADCQTIAAVHGFALGGGLELALSCDGVVAESDARLGLPEIKLGCYPPVAAALLPARVGWGAAADVIMTGEEFSAARAFALGLVQRVCDPGTLDAAVTVVLRTLLEKSPAVLREAKRAMREGRTVDPDTALARIERRYLDALMKLEDANEGIRAFMEKRPARFRNR